MTDATPDLLRRVGEALYGPRWQRSMARDLGRSDRTVRRWIAEGCDVPPDVRAELLRLVADRVHGLDDLAVELRSTA